MCKMPLLPLRACSWPMLQELVGLLFQLEAVLEQASSDMDWILLMTERQKQTTAAKAPRCRPHLT